MRALAPVAIVAIIAFTVLVLVLVDRRRKVEIRELRADRDRFAKEALAGHSAMTGITSELRVTGTVGGPLDTTVVQSYVDAYTARVSELYPRKGLPQ